MTLELDATLQERLRAWAGAAEQQAAALVRIARAGDDVVRVEEVVQARNATAQRRHDRYEIDPEDFLRADALSRQRGLDIVGVWHTHPDHPARPSETDRESAWPGWSYLILAVGAEGVRAMRSWRLDGGAFVEEALRPELAAAAVSEGSP